MGGGGSGLRYKCQVRAYTYKRLKVERGFNDGGRADDRRVAWHTSPPPHNTSIHTPGRPSRLSYLVPGKLYMYMALAFIRRLTAGSDG